MSVRRAVCTLHSTVLSAHTTMFINTMSWRKRINRKWYVLLAWRSFVFLLVFVSTQFTVRIVFFSPLAVRFDSIELVGIFLLAECCAPRNFMCEFVTWIGANTVSIAMEMITTFFSHSVTCLCVLFFNRMENLKIGERLYYMTH